ncbi:DUF3618 domain-containing protein [Streptomyces sp. NPDC001443]
MTRPTEEGAPARTPEELREQVERTRHELGATVAALAAKTDVKGRAQEKAVRIGQRAAARAAVLRERLVLRAGRARLKSAAVAARARQPLSASARDTSAGGVGRPGAGATPVRRRWAERAPGPVRDGAALGLRLSRDYRGVLVTTTAVAGAGWLLWRRKG